MGYLDKMIGHKISNNNGKRVLGVLLEANSVGIVVQVTLDSKYYTSSDYDYDIGDVVFIPYGQTNIFKAFDFSADN